MYEKAAPLMQDAGDDGSGMFKSGILGRHVAYEVDGFAELFILGTFPAVELQVG